MVQAVSLAFLGDLMLGRGVSRKLRGRRPAWFWGDVLPILQQSDAVIANLESPITTSDTRWRKSWKLFHFRADPPAVGILKSANIRFVCLANNHMLDFDEPGLRDTLRTLDAAGILHAGAGLSADEAAAPAMLALPGLKIGLIAATDNMRAFAAGPDQPGTNHIEIARRARDPGWIEQSVGRLRQQGAGLVVLSLHWGPNMRTSPRSTFRRFARAAIDCGVDVIHGHSAHVVHGVERYRQGIILYDTGNILDDYWKFPFRETTSSFVFLLDLRDGRASRLRMVPVQLKATRLNLAVGETSAKIIERMTALCTALGTPVAATPEGLEVVLA